MNRRFDGVIIGAGAAGLAAAVSMEAGLDICLMDKNEIPGRKILATGGGRCNLTNEACAGRSATLDFFHSLGLETRKTNEGLYYPYSGCASDVVKVLTDPLKDKVEMLLGTTVRQIRKTQDGFIVAFNHGGEDSPCEEVSCRAVLLACGGKAAPQFGTTGDGYGLARSLGHTVTRTYPILTGIRCGDFHDLKGIRAMGQVTLLKDGRELAREKGEIQFTSDGISGICVFNLTPLIQAEEGEDFREALTRFTLSLDLAAGLDPEEVAGRKSSFGIVTQALADRIPPESLKDWRLPVLGVKGWKDAQCTAGGVSLEEIHLDTMESGLCPGLYFAGELLDVQGPCGGFNLQNAWETGIRAAKAMSIRLGEAGE